MEAKVDQLAQEPLKTDLRESFARIARLSFVDYALAATKALTQDELVALNEQRKLVGYVDTLGDLIDKPNLAPAYRELVYKRIPALRPAAT